MAHVEPDQTFVPKESYALEHTPTWAVGLVCVIFIALSLLMQRGLQKLGTWLVKRHQKSLNEALSRVKEELMLLGFISLLLTAAQNPISRLCMPDSWADHMLPCHFDQNTESLIGNGPVDEAPRLQTPPVFTTQLSSTPVAPRPIAHHIRALLVEQETVYASSTTMGVPACERESYDVDQFPMKRDRRVLSGITIHHYCSPGYVPVLSTESLHQLHIFIFVMAVVHVFYSCFTMLFGFTQLRSWKKWEEETCVDNYNYTAEMKKSFNESTNKKRAFGRQNTFVSSRTSNPWSTTVTGSWIVITFLGGRLRYLLQFSVVVVKLGLMFILPEGVVMCMQISFFRQFGRSVTKSDYLTLRLGFIKNHNAPMKLNFYRYMMRSLEDDLTTVTGISGYLWMFVIFFMVLNVHGWYTYFWMSFVPVLINIVIGTKLQHIITQLAMETAHSHGMCDAPIKLRDELFWFNNPHVLLYLIHFVLFQNAFELAFCIWLVTTFGFNSCFFNQHGFIITRVIVGILAQVLCSYSTLPLYALVSQMGSHYKKAIFDLPVSNAIKGWCSKAKETRRKLQQELNKSEHQKAFEHLNLHLPRLSSDGSSRHSSISHRHSAHEDHLSSNHDNYFSSSHHGIILGHKFHLHDDTPKTPKTPKTPRTPRSKSNPLTPAAAIATGAGAANSPEKNDQCSARESFELSVPVLKLVSLGTPRMLSFRLPREESLVERDGPVLSPLADGVADRMLRLPSRKIKLLTTDDSFHPSSIIELASSSSSPRSLVPSARAAALLSSSSFPLLRSPMARRAAATLVPVSSAASILPTSSSSSTTKGGENHSQNVNVAATSPSIDDHETESIPSTTEEVEKRREDETV